MASPKAPSARVLGNRAARVIVDRAALDAITLAVADGAFGLAKEVVGGSDAPDATPFGVGLLQGGGVLAFVGSKRVGAWATGPVLPFTKPRAAKLSKGITVIGGFGFPARFQEAGTIHHPADPFLTPELMATLPEAQKFIKAACERHRVVGKQRAARGDVFSKGLK